jgi:hypothetical protein
MENRRGPIGAAPVGADMLVCLDGAKGVEELTDKDRQSSGYRGKHMHRADIPVGAARVPHGILHDESDVRSLARPFTLKPAVG